MVRVRISQVCLAITAAALTAAVSGCGQGGGNNAQTSSSQAAAAPSSTSTTTPSSSAPAAAPAPVSAPAVAATEPGLCKSADLKLSLGHGDAAAGTAYRPLVFTNISDHSCVIQGFPGVSYVGGPDGHQIGRPAEREGNKGPAITLGRGEQANAVIGFATVQNYDAAVCRPEAVRGLRVYPPQETASMYLENAGTGCANENLPGNQLTVRTVEKGAGEP
jgi:Protein of unknown function (DUF4232)